MCVSTTAWHRLNLLKRLMLLRSGRWRTSLTSVHEIVSCEVCKCHQLGRQSCVTARYKKSPRFISILCKGIAVQPLNSKGQALLTQRGQPCLHVFLKNVWPFQLCRCCKKQCINLRKMTCHYLHQNECANKEVWYPNCSWEIWLNRIEIVNICASTMCNWASTNWLIFCYCCNIMVTLASWRN